MQGQHEPLASRQLQPWVGGGVILQAQLLLPGSFFLFPVPSLWGGSHIPINFRDLKVFSLHPLSPPSPGRVKNLVIYLQFRIFPACSLRWYSCTNSSRLHSSSSLPSHAWSMDALRTSLTLQVMAGQSHAMPPCYSSSKLFLNCPVFPFSVSVPLSIAWKWLSLST